MTRSQFSATVLCWLLASVAGPPTAYAQPSPVEESSGAIPSDTGERTWRRVGPAVSERGVAYAAATNAQGLTLVGVRPDGLFLSVAGTWRRTRGPFRRGIGPNTESLAVAPSNQSLIYVGLERRGILRSETAGHTWTDRSATLPRGRARNVVCVAVLPSDAETAWIGTDGGLFKTTDGGATWQPLTTGLPTGRVKSDGDRHLTIAGLCLDPANPESMLLGVYATGLTAEGESEPAGVYRSSDGGETWEASSEGLDRATQRYGSMTLRNDWVRSLSRSRRDPAVAYVATLGGVFRSSDGGRSWRRLPAANGSLVACVPWSDAVVLARPDGGVEISSDAGKAWRALGRGLPTGANGENDGEPLQVTLINADGTRQQVEGRRFDEQHLVRAFAFDELRRVVFACSTTGLYSLPLPAD